MLVPLVTPGAITTATGWSALDILARQGIQFGVVMILARILTPYEFGTVAVLTLFIGIGATLAEGGLGTIVVQRRDLTGRELSTVFWLTVSVGSVVAAVLALSSWGVAAFYDRPVLQPLTVVMSLSVVTGGVATVPLALLTKALDFRQVFLAGLLSTVLSAVVALALAVQGAGVWALGAQVVVASLFRALALWYLSRWRPAREFSVRSARELFGYGGYILGANLLDVAYTRAYTVLLGRLRGLGDVGIYQRADDTSAQATSLLSNAVGRVTLPLFSAAAHDPDRLRWGVAKSVRVLMFVNVPILLTLAATADPFILLLFGDRWVAAGPVLAILALGGSIWPLHIVNLQALIAQGRARAFFRLELVKKPIGIVALAIGATSGLTGMAWGALVAGIVGFVINARLSARHLQYGARPQLRDVAPVYLAAVPGAGLAYLLVERVSWHAGLETLTGVLLSVSCFVLLSVVGQLVALDDTRGAVLAITRESAT